MRHFIVLIGLFLIGFECISQNTEPKEIIKLLKNNQVKEAQLLSDKMSKDENTSKNPEIWFYRGLVYHFIYESHDPQIKALDTSAIYKAFESYNNVLILDTKKTFFGETVKALGTVANQIVYEGIQLFNNKKYSQALNCFETSLSIGKLPSINQMDTIVLYNCAISAEKCNLYDKAISYYNDLIIYKFGGVQMYVDLAKLLKSINKIDRFFTIIQEGIRSYPNETYNLYSELINYYLEIADYKNALRSVQDALKLHDKDAGLHYLSASLNELLGNVEVAEKEYIKTIEIDNTMADAYFNLASIYYNRGVDLLKKAMTKEDKSIADSFYKKAMTNYEKVMEITPDNVETAKILFNLYGYLNMPDKQNEIKTKHKL